MKYDIPCSTAEHESLRGQAGHADVLGEVEWPPHAPAERVARSLDRYMCCACGTAAAEARVVEGDS